MKNLKLFSKLFVILGLFMIFAALSPGDPAPHFAAQNQDGKVIHLSDLKGKFVLLYFYPKDDTPGCTKEACSFRDGFETVRKHGAVVFGVSKQDAESHKAFRTKHKLPFDLLVDTDGKLAEQFGIESMPGVGYFKRQSVLIRPDGKIAKTYKDVNPDTHAQQVLQDIEGQQGGLQ
jgi:peroxiredoxin Q/BCP